MRKSIGKLTVVCVRSGELALSVYKHLTLKVGAYVKLMMIEQKLGF